MKNVLFATTALVAFAGAAAAEVTVGGYGYAGVLHDGATTYVDHSVRLTFSATVETSSGVTFGASTRMNINNATAPGAFNRGRIDMTAGGLSVALGGTHGAMKTLARVATFHGFNDGGGLYIGGGTGVDNNISTHNDSGNNLLVKYDTGALSVAASVNVTGAAVYELAAKYTTNGFSVGAGFSDQNAWMLALGYSMGNVGVNIGTNDQSDITVTASYAINSATSVGFGFDKNSVGNNIGLQVSHDLGGASLIGNVGRTETGNSIAGLGVFFSF